MSLARIAVIQLRGEDDVVVARRGARDVARALGFDAQDQIRIATATSELARNAAAYARDGQVEFLLRDETRPAAFAVRVEDRGGGIPHLEAVLDGSYRSATGMGKGIAGARRLVDRFEIETGPLGTKVCIEKDLPPGAPSMTPEDLARIAESLARDAAGASHELRQQNAELMQALQELAARGEELEALAAELESTNRGVVALHGELEATANELRRVSDQKTRFLSNISHEFRTPLNSILALSRLLIARTDGGLTEEQERQVRFISDAAQSLTGLVDDLLDIAKVEAGKIDVNPVRFSVHDLFGALRGLLRPLKAGDAVELVFEEPDGVPVLLQDEGKITQILRNFISNALKFTPHGEVRVSAEYKEPDRVLFCVRDTGIGIPREYHERIFEEFEQVPHALQAKIKGTGLGLPLSRRLASLMRGQVAVASTPGEGSSFFLDVPARWHEDAESVPTTRKADRPRVLIADDEEAFRYVMRRMIDGTRYEILESGDGEDAVRLAIDATPDVIILDINMPGLDGYGVLDALGTNPATRAIPVIVSSSLVLSDRDRTRLGRSHAILSKSALSSDALSALLAQSIHARGGAR